MAIRYFDLNIEEVLENWETHHAIREIIANALDEQMLTSTREIRIFKDQKGNWHIQDFGRGLQIEHFTLNEDPEKLNSELPIIGKFGVGLKDALATFHRRGVGVIIRSPYGLFRLQKEQKHGFDSIKTLHVEYDDTRRTAVGTDVELLGVSAEDISLAKRLFLMFSGETHIESTQYGQILVRGVDFGKVYILGVLAAAESNFLFSYNITSLTESMKKRLNRERLNVGRTTYVDRVKAILKGATSDTVKDALVEQVYKRSTGDQCDELGWIEISQHALNLMYQKRQVAYVTETELQAKPDLIGVARTDGYEVVVISDRQKTKLEEQARAGGAELRTLDVYAQEYNESFEYDFIDRRELSRKERRIFDLTPRLLSMVGISNHFALKVRISKTTRVTTTDTEGVWDPSIRSIVIKRSALSSLRCYAGTLLHEAAHASTGAPDVSRRFEGILTDFIGILAEIAVRE